MGVDGRVACASAAPRAQAAVRRDKRGPVPLLRLEPLALPVVLDPCVLELLVEVNGNDKYMNGSNTIEVC